MSSIYDDQVCNISIAYKDGGVQVDFEIWLKVAIVCLLGAMSPGPSLAIIIRNATLGGQQSGILTAVGHGIGVSIYACCVVVGLGLVLNSYPDLFTIISWVGVVFLMWIGVSLVRSSFNSPKAELRVDRYQGLKGFAEGFTIAILNPKIMAFFLAIFSQFIGIQQAWSEKCILVLTAGVIDAGWYGFVVLFFVRGTAVSWLREHWNITNRMIGLFLICVAAFLSYSAI